jgi:nucleoside-diphosphate-sugar epimerase
VVGLASAWPLARGRSLGSDSSALICDRSALDGAFPGASTVIHLAARPSVPKSITDPVGSHVVNVSGTRIGAGSGTTGGRPHVIAASSSSVRRVRENCTHGLKGGWGNSRALRAVRP